MSETAVCIPNINNQERLKRQARKIHVMAFLTAVALTVISLLPPPL